MSSAASSSSASPTHAFRFKLFRDRSTKKNYSLVQGTNAILDNDLLKQSGALLQVGVLLSFENAFRVFFLPQPIPYTTIDYIPKTHEVTYESDDGNGNVKDRRETKNNKKHNGDKETRDHEDESDLDIDVLVSSSTRRVPSPVKATRRSKVVVPPATDTCSSNYKHLRQMRSAHSQTLCQQFLEQLQRKMEPAALSKGYSLRSAYLQFLRTKDPEEAARAQKGGVNHFLSQVRRCNIPVEYVGPRSKVLDNDLFGIKKHGVSGHLKLIEVLRKR